MLTQLLENYRAMDKKYFEYIALYLLVIIASVVIAAIAWIVMIAEENNIPKTLWRRKTYFYLISNAISLTIRSWIC